MLRIAEVGIGPASLKDVAAVFRPEGTFEKYMSPMMTAPIIGALAGNVLRDFRVEIDYKNGFTYLERSASTGDAELLSVGLILEAGADGNPLVSGMSSAAASDVKARSKQVTSCSRWTMLLCKKVVGRCGWGATREGGSAQAAFAGTRRQVPHGECHD